MSIKRRLFKLIFFLVCLVVLFFILIWAAYEIYGKNYVTQQIKKNLGPNSHWHLQAFNPLTLNLRVKFNIPGKSGTIPINKRSKKSGAIDYHFGLNFVSADISILKTFFSKKLLFSKLVVKGGFLNLRYQNYNDINFTSNYGSQVWVNSFLPIN